ncbi:PDZ and LIM domain protein Zasp isoform X2 [Planococcus citri]|uniref:PDZ and LIM domain protein Zasp isoform X2 n=1 Tax=Planococcus citri TaxID=170843 RepID=UPI0031F7B849
MAQLLTIRLTRNDSSTSWGFRLQGGKDFGTPLLIQKVNIGSLAEKAGLQVGDAVIRVNGKEVADVRHKDAQDVIVRAGNLVEFTIQRGGNVTWKPAVTPVGSVPSPNPYISTSPSPVTKTSLASSPHQSPRIPQGFNSSSKPYSPQQVNGGGGGGGYVNENGSIKAIVNKQYNTPVGIYSDESIAETLSAQAEVLAGGVLGVNFKKNEKNYNAENSEVFKMVLEAEKEPKSPEPERPSSASYFASLSHAVGGQATSSRPQTPTAALIDRPRSTTNSPIPSASAPKRSSDPDNLTCSECRQNIVGVFVRIKEKNLHVECFKCATCGTSLKNVGYYSINNKLYCDIHAKMVARQNPPAPNLEPITISPSQQGASKIISTALIANSNSASLSPQPTLAPVPFHPPRQSPTHVPSPVPQSQPFSAVNGSKSYSPSSTFSSPISAPKPVAVETHKPSPVYSSETQPVSYYNPSQKRLPFLKPRAEKASAFMPVMKSSHSKPVPAEPTSGHTDQYKLSTVFESLDQDDPQAIACHRKKLSLCSEEVKSVFSLRNLAGSPACSDRPESPVPSESADEFQHYETPIRNKPLLELVQSRPHSVRSLSPCERPITPNRIVVFPPEMPECYHPRVASPLPIYSRPHHDTQREPHTDPVEIFSEDEKSSKSNDDVLVCVFERTRETAKPEEVNDDEGCKCIIEKTRETLKITCISPVPTQQPTISEVKEEQEENITLESLPRPVTPAGYIASLLTTASNRPFTPIEPAKATIFTEPVPLPPETIPYLPTSKEENHRLLDVERPVSPMTYALTTAPERSYSPLPTIVKFEDLFPPEAEPLPHEEPKRPSLADALTVAPRRSYTPLSRGVTEQIKEEESDIKVPDLSEDPSVILTKPVIDIKKCEKDTKKSSSIKSMYTGPTLISSPYFVTEAAFPPICDELKAKFEKRLRTGSISDKNAPKNTSGDSVKEVEEKRTVSARSPFTPTGLYKPINLPHYQQCVKELTNRNKTPLSRRNTPTPKGPESRKSTPTPRSEISRKNTPTPRGEMCRKPTPTSFEATVSTQQKVFHPEIASGALKTSALTFLTQTKDISEKIPPVLGYQPGSIVENMSSYTKVEQCVRTVCEKTLKQIQASGPSAQSCSSQSNELRVVKTNISACSSPVNTPGTLAKEEMQPKKHSRPSTPVKKSSRPSTPVRKSSRPSTPVFQPNIMISSQQHADSPDKDSRSQQHFYPSTQTSSQTNKTASSSQQYVSSTQMSSQINKTTSLSQQHARPSTRTHSQTSQMMSQSEQHAHCPTQASLSQQHARQSTQTSSDRHVRPSAQHPTQTSQQHTHYPPQTSLSQQHAHCPTQTSSSEQHVRTLVQTPTQTSQQHAHHPHQTSLSQEHAHRPTQTSSERHIRPSTQPPTQTSQQHAHQPTQTSSSERHVRTLVQTPTQTSQQHAHHPPHTSLSVQQHAHPSTQTSSSQQQARSSTQTSQTNQTTSSSQQQFHPSTQVSSQSNRTISSSQQQTTSYPSTQVSSQPRQTASSPQLPIHSSTKTSAQPNHSTTSSQQHFYTSSSLTKSMAASNITHSLSKTLTAIASSKHQSYNISSKNLTTSTITSSDPNLTGSNIGAGSRAGTSAGLSAPRRGKGVWNPQNQTPGARIPLCAQCSSQIRGPFITALGKIWCPEHFICVNKTCRRSLLDIGFVEEPSGLHCEYCFEKYLAPTCGKCSRKIKGDCLNAIGKHFHPECFVCAYCNKLFGNSPFFLEEGLPYCENDWNELFTTKCFACGFPIEAGDRWVEALNNNYHSPCFNCTTCKSNLEGQSFYAKGGRPFCKSHAR